MYNAVYGDDNKRKTSVFRVNATRNYLCITPHNYDTLWRSHILIIVGKETNQIKAYIQVHVNTVHEHMI